MKARNDGGQHEIDDLVALEETGAQRGANRVQPAKSGGRCDGELSFHPVTS